MAYTTINKSTDYFNTKLYTGNAGTQSITGVGYQPDMTWIKRRGSLEDHALFDAVRGATKRLFPSRDYTEATQTGSLTSFDSDGFSLGNGDSVNGSDTYASWNWLANGTGSANTDGSINSTVSANTTAGFSIVKWIGTGSSGTIGHGLGVAPKVVIVKRYTAAADWVYYTTVIDGSMDFLYLNATGSKGDSSVSVPTSTVFSKNDTNGETQIAYCFAEKTGYSKFGSYTGLGGTNYPFIYTGFKPAFVMAKRTDNTSNWVIYDNKRQYNNIEGQYNPQRPRLAANLGNAESSFTSDNGVDLLSNGFVARDNSNDAYTINISGATYIYMAFAEAPLVGTNNIPCTAR